MNKVIRQYLWVLVPFLFIVQEGVARENVGGYVVRKSKARAAGCNAAEAQMNLEINNVRTTILTGGDMWWDLSGPRYEIPKLPENSTEQRKHSLFAGSLWIGGVDAGGQLKVAAMTYRQTGNDFWPGPLNTVTAETDEQTCKEYDKIFRISRAEVEDFAEWYANKGENPSYTIPSSIADWPAHGKTSKGHDYFLAPFYDNDKDGTYDPNAGDYPFYDLNADQGCEDDVILGDETLWWVFNDKGNIHTETSAEPIGLEIRAQAFGFQTNDDINNMTFYKYKIINRSTFKLNQTYFGVWVDADLGNYSDDYVGCDVARGLGYCYNGDADDEGVFGYGVNPPAVGVDFFQGPLADANDGVDNDRDSIIDEPEEQIIMSKFVYYNNDFSVTGNPQNGTHVYNYLRGIFKDGSRMEYGGTGHGPSGGTNGTECDFMFPGESDPYGWGTGGIAQSPWSEETVDGNSPADRRFLQSAGPFTLEPGAVNNITFGVVWAKATSGGPFASVERLQATDDKAQLLFDNCFKVLNGPDAPTLITEELDNEVILILSNNESSNNYKEEYQEKDPLLQEGSGDAFFRFQGYEIYQLADASVSITEIDNPDRARLVAQCDVADGVSKLINFTYDSDLGIEIPKLMVEGGDVGIEKTFQITEDLFASGEKTLVNFKTYYYTAIAYGNNSHPEQKSPYKAGRRNIRTYAVMPHPGGWQEDGKVVSEYGQHPEIIRESGYGIGGNFVHLSESTLEEVISSGSATEMKYNTKGGPVDIKVIDPVNLKGGDYEISLVDTTGGELDDAFWILVNEDNDTVYSERTIGQPYTQVIPEWGFSVNLSQVTPPGNYDDTDYGFIGATIEFGGEGRPWLTGVKDAEGINYANWIRSGRYAEKDASNQFKDFVDIDDNGVYEKVLEGTIAPYALASHIANGVATDLFHRKSKIETISSVDIYITSDKSKWTRCPVLELGDAAGITIGGASKFRLRMSPSVDQNGEDDGSGTFGMGWFPGYAVDVETGERLNMMFGENSFLQGDNGGDLIWNPSDREYSESGQIKFGGMQPFYVVGTENGMPTYDQGQTIFNYLSANNYTPDNVTGYRDWIPAVQWVYGYPLWDSRYTWLESDVKISLRVKRPYALDGNGALPKYRFNTDDLIAQAPEKTDLQDRLDRINIAPNPYYAYSQYETGQLDNRVRIVNLPKKCKIKIFTLNGTLIREFDKDNDDSYLDWDLKNSARIPIASGLYIVHIDVDGVGEKVLKWFGVMRPVDLDTF